MSGFNWCVPAMLFPHGQPLFGLQGLTVIEIFGVGTPMIIVSLYVLGIWTFTCAMWTRYPSLFSGLFTTGEVPRRRSSLRNAVFLYQFITGFFFLALVTQLNKMVVLMAAIHNWCEWIILGNVYIGVLNGFGGRGGAGITLWNKIFTAWIAAVMMGILLIDDVLASFAFEEVFGLWPDFQLFFISAFCMWKFRKNDEAKGVFWPFFAAAAFHLAQIFLLLFEGMGMISPWPTAQVGIIFTAFFNYALYSTFALKLDRWQEKSVYDAGCTEQAAAIEEGRVSPTAAGDDAAHLPKQMLTRGGAPKSRSMSAFVPSVPAEVANVGTCRIVLHMLACLVLSSAFVMVPPLALGDCVVPVTETTGPYFNWTTFHFNSNDDMPPQAFQNVLAESMASARQSHGNLMSKVFLKNGQAFRLDKWLSKESADLFYASDTSVAHSDVGGASVKSFVATSTAWQQLEAQGSGNENFTVPQDLRNASTFCLSSTTSGYTHLRIKEEFHDAVKNKMAYMSDRSRKEGANFYLATMSASSESQFLVVEQWEDQDKLQHHLASPDVLRLFALSTAMTDKDGMDIEGNFRELVPCS